MMRTVYKVTNNDGVCVLENWFKTPLEEGTIIVGEELDEQFDYRVAVYSNPIIAVIHNSGYRGGVRRV